MAGQCAFFTIAVLPIVAPAITNKTSCSFNSDLFNILFVLGIAATISPITFIFENIIDILILTIFSLIVLYFGFTKHKIDRKEGIIMLLLYVAYLAYIIIR